VSITFSSQRLPIYIAGHLSTVTKKFTVLLCVVGLFVAYDLFTVHTADADEIKLSCLVCSCVHIANADSSKLGRDETKLSCLIALAV